MKKLPPKDDFNNPPLSSFNGFLEIPLCKIGFQPSHRTGATGYIGGNVFTNLVKKHPSYKITLLLRNPPPEFERHFPNVKVVQGDFDSSEIISNLASEADIVIHNGDGDHANCLKAMIAGLLRRDKTSYLIKLSGTGILYDYPDQKQYLGLFNPKIYSDMANIDEIIARPAHAYHMYTDSIVRDAALQHGDKIKTAIVCPPDVYGRGQGPGRQLSWFIPFFVESIRKLGVPFYMREGSNARGWVHIDDLTQIYVSLVEAAVSENKSGYYLPTSQEVSQRHIAEATATILHGKGTIPSAIAKAVSEREIASLYPATPDLGFTTFACNSRSKADRAAEELRYVPVAPGFWDTLEGDLTDALDVATESPKL
ncbi:hypothetical protein EG328_000285 [Venturia inaequalis]|uniref:NAD(P)-binding domain-containing protein n=1 Tax=Venturia inaequalis TaxID=5025 RepID=A0A8H3V3P2_VENIN|nr:hypothetical protein EG328_000285 [Venturia inaequalis]